MGSSLTAFLRRSYWWILPVLFCAAYHWRILDLWFRADDFGWLGLRLSITKFSRFLEALFQPMAQGTVRFLSERAFFLSFEWLFGLNALPFRVAVLTVLCANSILLAAVTRHITGAASPAVAASILWTVSAGLTAAAGWLSSSNQIFFSLFFLLAFWFFLNRRWLACYIFYLLGFGTLESMVVFPGVCLAYAALLDRSRLTRGTLALFAPALAFLPLHLWVIPKPQNDPGYRLHLSPSALADTFSYYWRFGFGTDTAPVILCTAVIAAGIAYSARRRRYAPLFGFVWFLLLVAPVLPLQDHRMEYYAASSGMALAFLLASASFFCCGSRALGIAAFAAIAFYSEAHARRSGYIFAWHKERTEATRRLVEGIFEAQRLQPGRTIFLDGVSNALFWDAVFDNPYRLVGRGRVYLAPGTEAQIDSHPEWGGVNEWILPAKAAEELLLRNEAVVLRPVAGCLDDVTHLWRDKIGTLPNELSPFVDAGNAAFDAQLREGWYERDGNSFRWMGRRASVVLNAKRIPGRELQLTGYRPAAVSKGGPIQLEVRAGGINLGQQSVAVSDGFFELRFVLPPRVQETENLPVEIIASRVTRVPPDPRELSVIFGTIQVR